jgi:hypothetical protein
MFAVRRAGRDDTRSLGASGAIPSRRSSERTRTIACRGRCSTTTIRISHECARSRPLCRQRREDLTRSTCALHDEGVRLLRGLPEGRRCMGATPALDRCAPRRGRPTRAARGRTGFRSRLPRSVGMARIRSRRRHRLARGRRAPRRVVTPDRTEATGRRSRLGRLRCSAPGFRDRDAAADTCRSSRPRRRLRASGPMRIGTRAASRETPRWSRRRPPPRPWRRS